MPAKNSIKDCHLKYLLKKNYVPALFLCDAVNTSAATSPTFVFQVSTSIGSPTYSPVPLTRHKGLRLTAATTSFDYLWRVPSDVERNLPIYFRHHWAVQALGTTQTATFQMNVQTLTSATALASSPTAVLNVLIPDSTNNNSASSLSLTLTGRGSIQPLATGLQASHVLDDQTEYLHLVTRCLSTNFTIAQANVFWLGMDIEYTPRLMEGDGSRREGGKLETNLGYQLMGATNDY